MKGRRGQGLSTNAIILIILGVVILAILIIGFTLGWDSIAPWLSKNNVNNIVTACETACGTGNMYEFCTMERTLKADDLPGAVKEVKGTCKFFATDSEYEKYGIDDCPAITCPPGEESEGEISE